MRKIPTLFMRDENDRRYVLPEVTPGCEWVLAGEGVATRKYDGTCCMFDGERWWARREIKPGKSAPDGFVEVEHDPTTGKTVGWEPAEQSGFAKWITEAVEHKGDRAVPGTYELIGPKVNGNPEGAHAHRLVNHDEDTEVYVDAPRDFDHLRHFLLSQQAEGIVWHHPDGRMVKLKRRDFPASGRFTEGEK